MRRVAVVQSHPIQYQAPWFRQLAATVDLTVFFCHRQSAEGQASAGFGVAFDWDVPLLEGYHHEWLTNVARSPSVDRFEGCDTPEVIERLRQGRFDACLVGGWYLKSYLQTIRACRGAGIPVLVRGDSQLKGPRSLAARVAKYVPYRWFLRRIDAHLYVGRANRAYLRHYGVPEERLFFAPHFVDNDRFARQAQQARADGWAAALRRQWAIDPGATVFLFAGKLIAKKRPHDFLASIAAVRRQGVNAVGVFVGSGPDQTALEEAAAGEPIVFAGFRNQSQMAACYAAADCLVLPSDGRETWGLVVNEAMATGLPAIVSEDVGCAPDLIDQGRTGFTFSVGDRLALGARLAAFAGLAADQREAMRTSVLERIGRYTSERATEGLVAAVEHVQHTRWQRNRNAAPQHA
jgi:glycosyltransferase involved in cell wall biosynthesis